MKFQENSQLERGAEWVLFGLREQAGSHKGFISRTKMMTQAQADEINKKIYCIKWVTVAGNARSVW